jgi:hypothetical protein
VASKKAGYLEVQKNDLPPKELDESQVQVADALRTQQQPAQQRASYSGAASGASNGGTGGGNGPIGAAANAAPVAPSTVAQSPPPAPPPPTSQAAPTTTVAKSAKPAPQESTPALDAELKKAVDLAQQSKCVETAKVTENIRQESAAFYAQRVADNRALKDCLTYVKNEADRNSQIANRKAAKAKPTSTDEGSGPPAAAAPKAAPPADADQAPAKK